MDKENVNNVGQSSAPEESQVARQSLEGSAKLQGEKLGDTVSAGASAGDGPGAAQGGDMAQESGRTQGMAQQQGGGQGIEQQQGVGQGLAQQQGGGPGMAQQQGGGQQGMSAERRQGRGEAGVLRPPVDVIEDAQGITLMADMPGVSKDNLNLRLDAQNLTIEGAMSLQLPQQLDSRYAEIRHQHYERTFALSRELDGEKATAELAHGVLKVRIPKTAHATPRKIPVNVASA
jgi:HSP20 family protein